MPGSIIILQTIESGKHKSKPDICQGDAFRVRSGEIDSFHLRISMPQFMQLSIKARLEPVAPQRLERFQGQIDAREQKQADSDDRQQGGQSDQPVADHRIDRQRQARSHERSECQVQRRQGETKSVAPAFEPLHLIMLVLECSAGKSSCVTPRSSLSARSFNARILSTTGETRFDVEMINDALAVMKIAGVIMAVKAP